MPEIIIKSQREKAILHHHPWIFSGAVERVCGDPSMGATVDVISSSGEFLAKAAYSPHSNIIGRIWTWEINDSVDPDFLRNRLSNAMRYRIALRDFIPSNAMRLVHGESDGMPGLILDQYQDLFVVKYLSAGVEYWKEVLSDLI